MNEIDLIKGYLKKHGSEVIDVVYYNETFTTAADVNWNFGTITGETVNQCWMFGNITIDARFAGVIVLTNEMYLQFTLQSVLRAVNESVYYGGLGVNFGMSLLGNGQYEGIRRIYNIGFNRATIAKIGFGAATFSFVFNFNGYKFRLR